MASTSQNLSLTLLDLGELPGTWGTPTNANLSIIDALFAGVTGHNHSGDNGQGAQIAHADLLNSGTFLHSEIDDHINNAGLHENDSLGTVQDEPLTTTILDVNTLRFANSTVEEVSAGVVLITPTTGGSVELDRKIDAPVVFYDNFSGPSNLTLESKGFQVTKGATNAPEYRVLPTQTPVGTSAVLSITSTDGRSGSITNLVEDSNPHSPVQRVLAAVDTYGPEVVSVDDNYTLSLKILSAITLDSSNNQREVGLECRLRTQEDNGELKLVLEFGIIGSTFTYSILATDFPAPAGFVHPDGLNVWNLLPLEYFTGTHEFSLSQTDDSPFKFQLSYYYNSGLIFKVEYEDTDPEGILLQDLLDYLENNDTPRLPTFGRFGWKTTYSLSDSQTASYQVKSFFGTAKGEQLIPDVVTLPTVEDPGTPVCPGNSAWDGITFPGIFDPDGAGPLQAAEYDVVGTFPASGPFSEGFTIENVATGERFDIYCDPPTFDDDQNNNTSSATDQNINIPGVNVSVGEFSRFFFNPSANGVIPVDWEIGNSGATYSTTNTLPTSFIQAIQATRVDQSNQNVLDLELRAGRRLPWQAGIDVTIAPLYQSDAAYTVRIQRALQCVNGTPIISQNIAYKYNEQAGAWEVISENNQVCEGEYVLFSVAGDRIPLGVNFWSSVGTFDDGYGIQNTLGINTTTFALRLISDPTAAFQILWNRIRLGRLDLSQGIPVTGAPPTTPVLTEDDPGVGVLRQPTEEEHVVIIGRVAPNAWRDTGVVPVELGMRDTEVPNIFPNVELLDPAFVCPAPPTADPGSNASDTGAGQTTELTIDGNFFDNDVTIESVTGFDPAFSVDRNDGNVTVVAGSEAGQETWTITGLTISSTVGEDIVIRMTNPSSVATYPANSTSDFQLGTVDEVFNQTPDVTYGGGTLVEGEVATITLDVDTTTIEPNTTVEVIPALGNDFSVVNVDKTGPIVADQQEWLVDIATVDQGGQGPNLCDLIVTNPISTNSTLVEDIPVTQIQPPTVTDIDLISPDSNILEWDITEGDQITAFVKVDNAAPASVQDIQATNGTGAADIRRLSFEYAPEIAVDTFRVFFVREAGNAGDTFNVSVTKSTGAGPLTGTSAQVVTLTAEVNIDGSNTTFNNQFEGRNFEFSLPGSYDTGSSIAALDFRDEFGTSLLAVPNPLPVVNNFTDTLIEGSGQLGDDIDGTNIYVYMQYSSGASDTVQTTTNVLAPPNPVIGNFSLSPAVEGTLGASITINGGFLEDNFVPTGQTDLDFNYTFTSSGGPILSNVVQTSATPTQVTFTADILPSTAGLSLGLDIDYLGGNLASFTNLVTIAEAGAGGPQSSGLTFDGPNGGNTSTAPNVGTETTLTITGTGLGVTNVGTDDSTSPVQFSIVGYDNGVTGETIQESPPGAGLSPERTRQLYSDAVVVTQSDTQITVRVSFPQAFIDTRVRVHLMRPSSHPLGAGEWSQASIDAITPMDPYHLGMTVIGPQATSTTLNSDPSFGLTRLDTARDLQNQLTGATGGTQVSITARFATALTEPPVVLAVVDPQWNAYFRGITVSATGSPFEWTITGIVPSISTLNDYPHLAYLPSDPVIIGFKLVNGVIIASGTVKGVQWTTPAAEADFFTPL